VRRPADLAPWRDRSRGQHDAEAEHDHGQIVDGGDDPFVLVRDTASDRMARGDAGDETGDEAGDGPEGGVDSAGIPAMKSSTQPVIGTHRSSCLAARVAARCIFSGE
jgi:hypothetical protein